MKFKKWFFPMLGGIGVISISAVATNELIKNKNTQLINSNLSNSTISSSDLQVMQEQANRAVDNYNNQRGNGWINGKYIVNSNTNGIEFSSELKDVQIHQSGRNVAVTPHGNVFIFGDSLNTATQIALIDQQTNEVKWILDLNNMNHAVNGIFERITNVQYSSSLGALLVIALQEDDGSNIDHYSIITGKINDFWDTSKLFITGAKFGVHAVETELDAPEGAILSPIIKYNNDWNDTYNTNEFLFIPPGFMNKAERAEYERKIILTEKDGLISADTKEVSKINNEYDAKFMTIAATTFYNKEHVLCRFELNLYRDTQYIVLSSYRGGSAITNDRYRLRKFNGEDFRVLLDNTYSIGVSEENVQGKGNYCSNILLNYDSSWSEIWYFRSELNDIDSSNAKCYKVTNPIKLNNPDGLLYNIESAYYHRGVWWCYLSKSNQLGDSNLNDKPSLLALYLNNYVSKETTINYDWKHLTNDGRSGTALNGSHRANMYPINATLSKNDVISLPSWDDGVNANPENVYISFTNGDGYYPLMPVIPSRPAYHTYQIKNNINSFVTTKKYALVDEVISNIYDFINLDDVKNIFSGFNNNSQFVFEPLPRNEQTELAQGTISFNLRIHNAWNDGYQTDHMAFGIFKLTGFTFETILNPYYETNPFKVDQYLSQYSASRLKYLYDNGKKSEIDTFIINNITSPSFNQEDVLINYDDINNKSHYKIESINTINDNQIAVAFSVDNANTSDGGYTKRTFTINLSGFSNEQDSILKQQKINWDSSLFKNIFGSDKAFWIDWSLTNLDQYESSLKSYMQHNMNQFFENASNDITIKEIIMKNENVPTTNSTLISIIVKFQGYKNNQFVDLQSSNLSIELRPIPGPGVTYPSDDYNPFAGFKSYLQNEITKNNNIFPSTSQLQKIVANYLNQSNIKNNLPNIAIPNNGNGNFDANQIGIDESKINESANNTVTIDDGAIYTKDVSNSAPSIRFPGISVNATKITIQNLSTIDAWTNIKNYVPTELDDIFKNDPTNEKIVNIKNGLNQKIDEIFANLPSGANIDKIINITNDGSNKIDVTFNVTKVITNSGIVSNVQKSIIIQNFGTNTNLNTTVKNDKISWKSSWFSTTPDSKGYILFPGDKGYGYDWKHLGLGNKNQQLVTYMNHWIDYFFNEYSSSTKVISANIEVLSDTSAIANIVYTGYLNGVYTENLKGTITFELRPLPTSNDEIFNGFEDYLQSKVDTNNRVFPDDRTLKDWVADYLNKPEISDQLPDSCIPDGGFTGNDVNIDGSLIDKTSNPIKVQTGAITTTNQPQLTLPGANINAIVSTVQKLTSIDAWTEIRDFIPTELDDIFQTDPDNSQFQTILSGLNSRRNEIFTNLPFEATINKIIDVTNNNANEIVVSFNVTAFNSPTGIIQNVQKSITIKNFGTNANLNTTLKNNKISWKSSWFSTTPDSKGYILFPGDKGYGYDWKHLGLGNKNQQLVEYMNHWIDYFFNDYSSSTKVISANIEVLSDTSAIANIVYTGYLNGAYTENLKGTITFELRPLPTSNDEIFNGFEDYLQSKVDANNGVFPDDQTLKDWVADYLNKPEISDQLPDSCIPDGGFTGNDVNIDGSLIDKTSNPIKVQTGAITTTNQPQLTLPGANITTTISSVKNEIAADGIIKGYNATILDDIFKQNPNADEVQNIKTWLNQKIKSIFNTLPNGAEITQINNITELSKTSINVTFVVSKAYTLNGISNDVEFSINIINFTNSTNSTILNLTTIDANKKDPSTFNDIFGSDDKGFSIDWSNSDLTQKALLLKNYLNNNIDKVFSNPTTTPSKTSVTNVSFSTIKNDLVVATITYNGLEDGTYKQDITSNIDIYLKSSPSIDGSDTNPETNPLASFQAYLQNYINTVSHVFPNNNDLRNLIVQFLNEKLADMPDSWIPESGRFTITNIDLNYNAITFDEVTGEVFIKPGSIKIINTKLNEAINFPTINVSAKVTKIKSSEVKITGQLASLAAIEIVNDQVKEQLLLDWIQTNLSNIFENVDATKMQVINPAFELVGSENAIMVNITLTNAYQVNQIKNLNASFKIYGFSTDTSSLETNIKLTTINYFDNNFKTIFGSKDKGFAIDWKSLLTSKQDTLLDAMNKNKGLFFSNLNSSSIANQVNVTNVSMSLNNNVIKAKVTFIGLNASGSLETKVEIITINLRPTPEVVDIDLSVPVQEWIDINKQLPSDDNLKEIVKNELNNNLSNIPDAWIPGGSLGKFENNNIIIDNSLIKRDDQGNISGTDNAIKFQGSDDQLHALPAFEAKLVANNANVSEQSDWDTWVKYVLIASICGTAAILLVLLLIYIIKRRNASNSIAI